MKRIIRDSYEQDLVTNLTAIYPTSTIWLIGHSLGGGLASLLGTTFGYPAVAFEAPGERLAAQRLHLPLPPSSISLTEPYSPSFGSAPVTHVYHNADPIPQGACTGIGSPCTSAGFALESRCHLGKTIVFDTVERLNWKVDVRRHPIKEVILNVLEKDMEYGWDDHGRDVPIAEVEEDCVVSTYSFYSREVNRLIGRAFCRIATNGSLVTTRISGPRTLQSTFRKRETVPLYIKSRIIHLYFYMYVYPDTSRCTLYTISNTNHHPSEFPI